MQGHVLGVRFGVGLAAVQALFLVGEGDHANGPLRRLLELADQVAGRHGDAHACAVIDRAGAQVPRIQMTANHHHFLRQAAAGDLADHVVRGGRAIPAAIQRHLHRGAATGQQARQLIGIGHRQCCRRHRRQAVIETGDTGVRHAMRVGTRRAHQEADRALADRLRRALAADRAATAVVAAIAERQHLRTTSAATVPPGLPPSAVICSGC
ncbi:hypothetical protein G6F59_015187 [Rhizopus arrhizus]|nr:hypothetical protein G6F59_015187 [Rhizopus arrhizus]